MEVTNRMKFKILLMSTFLVFTLTVYSCDFFTENSSEIESTTESTTQETEITTEITTETTTEITTPEPTQPPETTRVEVYETPYETINVALEGQDYFKDIAIVGDSIASGYRVYNKLPANQCLAVGSVGARNIHTFRFNVDGAEYTIEDALAIVKPKYIYMSMGMNDININDSATFTNNYKALIDSFSQILPESKIVVLAITPIGQRGTFSDNESIDAYNKALEGMVEAMNSDRVFYMNAAKTLKNKGNYLEDRFASSNDALHLTPSAYDYLLTYIYENRIE